MARVNMHRITLSKESPTDVKTAIASRDITVSANWRVPALDAHNLVNVLDLAFLGQELPTLDASNRCLVALTEAYMQLFGSDDESNDFDITSDDFIAAAHVPYSDVIAYADDEYLSEAHSYEVSHKVGDSNYTCTKEYKKRRKSQEVTVAKEFTNENGDTVTLKTTTSGHVKERTLGVGKVFDMAAKGIAAHLASRAAEARVKDHKRWTYELKMQCIASGIVIRQ